MAIDRARLGFLFREDSGRIDARDWLRGLRTLAFVLIPFAIAWTALAPYAVHDIATSAFFAPLTVAAYAFAIIYAFVVLLVAVSYVNLSAKRFRDLGLPAPLGLAALVPLAALITGAAHWLQPRVSEVMSRGWVAGADGLLIVVALWSFYELGTRPAREP
jgi:uncharacterized membrane protein YhaH (DUF805 family)